LSPLLCRICAEAAWRPKDGQLVWRVPDMGAVWGSPVRVGNKLVWATLTGHVVVVAAKTGKVLAQLDIADRFFASPALADGVLYLGGESGKLYAINTL
jgi:eukaryotic-like serine/threonine-protein kinase